MSKTPSSSGSCPPAKAGDVVEVDRSPFPCRGDVWRQRRRQSPRSDRRDRLRRGLATETAEDQGRIAGGIVRRKTRNHGLDRTDFSASADQLMAQDRRHERLADPRSN